MQRSISVSASCCILWVLGGLLGSQSLGRARDKQQHQSPVASPVEEIYIARSVRESRKPPTEFCAQTRTGFSNSFTEDQYTLRSINTRGSDGRVVDTNVKMIGSIHVCFGQTADPALLTFYGEILLGSTAFKGTGECRRVKSDFPEPGVNVLRCFLDLSGLPGQYIGGQLTTNSMTSLNPFGLETDPRGYTQSSIATIRLWKKRTDH